MVGRNVSNVQSDFVVCDDQLVGRLAAEHLLQQGHERILFINSSENLSAKLRLKGFQEALQERGLDGNGEWVRPISSNHSVQHVLNKALDNEPRPTAIFCFCDSIAIEVMRELRRHELRIPEEVAVMGVDNLDFVGLLSPGLTTVDVQQSEMGIKSAELLLGKIFEPDKEIQEIILTPQLIVREST